MDINLRYIHASAPRHGIKLKTIYLFGKDSKGTYIEANKEKIYLAIERIKSLFAIIQDKSWEEVLEEPKKIEFKYKKNKKYKGD